MHLESFLSYTIARFCLCMSLQTALMPIASTCTTQYIMCVRGVILRNRSSLAGLDHGAQGARPMGLDSKGGLEGPPNEVRLQSLEGLRARDGAKPD